jgi:hypothetical protein
LASSRTSFRARESTLMVPRVCFQEFSILAT